MDNFLNDIKRLKSIADLGLLYAKNPFDRERYEELHHISLSMMARLTDTPLSKLTDFYLENSDYPTPKVDIRAFVMDNGEWFFSIVDIIGVLTEKHYWHFKLPRINL